MQIEEQDGHSFDERRENDASLFSYVSQQPYPNQHPGWDKWGGELWNEEKSGDVQDIFRSLPITPSSPQMPGLPPLFALPTLTTPNMAGSFDTHKMAEVEPDIQDEDDEGVSSQAPFPAPSSVQMHNKYVDMVEQAIERLNDAAKRIAAVEQKKDHRSPKASRLAPYRDISGQIQRHSTPMPRNPSTPDGYRGEYQGQGTEVTGSKLSHLWPWLPDTEENEPDLWADHTDPLIRRHFPNSAETARIEEEDVRRARAEGFRVARARRVRARAKAKRLRLLFACLAVLAVCALAVDTALVSLAYIHQHHPSSAISGTPTLTLTVDGATSNKVKYGEKVVMHLRHFSPSSKVYITHDVEEPVLFGNSTSLVHVDSLGAADATTSVDPVDWNPGLHSIDAEDVASHYTANAILDIIDAGPTRPSHLVIKDTNLDFGAGIQGSNTIEPLTLSNGGSGAINWAASSDKPWLILTPNQGVFSRTETLEVAIQRGTLSPGDYTGKITFSSNVGAPLIVSVQMTVNALPPNAGPVLMVTPAVLSFTAQDGGLNPSGQELVVSDPGTQPLSWSLSNNGLVSNADQNSFLSTANMSTANWLSVSPASGKVDPKGTSVLQVNVNSQNLLPGAYIDTLVFSSGANTLNNTQSVSISLTVMPQCSLTLGTGSMSFNSVANGSNSTVQALNLSATPGCSAINWHATASPSWLVITPNSGQASATTNSVISVSVNASSMSAGSYSGSITITAGSTSQTVLVSLTVQPPPPPGAPIMAASPLAVSFTAVQGQPNPNPQAVVISNTGHSALQWHTQITLLANTSSSWLGVSPTGNVVNPGQTGQMMVLVNASSLTPGDYNGQVAISGTDTSTSANPASGSPQTIAVQLHVLPPCGLQAPSSSALAFTTTQGGSNPAPQSVTFTASGSCNWPVNWQASITTHARWLTLSPLSGTITTSGEQASLTASVNGVNLAPGTYSTQVSIAASDATPTQAQGSPQVFSVTLTVLQPCQLQASTAGLNFSTATGQVSATQSITIQETGSCVRPVSWSVTSDSGSSSWLILSPPSGSDTGSGATISVSVNANSLNPGAYKGTITIAASGSGSAVVQGSPLTVAVNATVTGFTVSGSVDICVNSVCTTPLPGATVSLLNSGGTSILSGTADSSGNYSLSNVPLGTYTVSVAGTDASGVHYVGTQTVTVTGNMQSINVNVLPG